MTEEITNKISFDIRGSVLVLEISLGVLQTNIELALLMNNISRLINCHYIEVAYLSPITVYP
jgi:hypothetical protein